MGTTRTKVVLTDRMMAAAEKVSVKNGQLTEGDAIDLAWDIVSAALPEIDRAVREIVAGEVLAPTEAGEPR